MEHLLRKYLLLLWCTLLTLISAAIPFAMRLHFALTVLLTLRLQPCAVKSLCWSLGGRSLGIIVSYCLGSFVLVTNSKCMEILLIL